MRSTQELLGWKSTAMVRHYTNQADRVKAARAALALVQNNA